MYSTIVAKVFRVSLLMLLLIPVNSFADTTVLIVRHGEKPQAGLGQLSCRGFNRALALPQVLFKHFGKPDVIIAPNPGVQKTDKGVPYNYIRPLATVEPLAILLGIPVDTTLAFNDLMGLELRINAIIDAPAHQLTLIAWEHKIAEQVVRDFFQQRQQTVDIPHWDDDDFDSIFVITKNVAGKLNFQVAQQHLNKLSDHCPKQ